MTEAWLRGPIAGIPGLLQPMAHALVQSRDEIHALVPVITPEMLWTKPHGVASVGFHLQHIAGVLDRLTTYARGDTLSAAQIAYMKAEGTDPDGSLTVHALITALDQRIDDTLAQLVQTDETTLLDFRGVGRAQLPSTVLGLLMHAAEHTTRHLGQLLVTTRVQQQAPDTPNPQ